MPQPAEPAPSTATRCSVSGTPVTLIAASSVPGRHRGRALDVVVEGAEPVSVAVEQAGRVVLRKILPLQHHARPALWRRPRRRPRRNRRTPGRARARAAIRHRAGRRGIRGCRCRRRGGSAASWPDAAAAAGVERQLADRNAHAAGALVAEAENALAIGDDDHLDIVAKRGCARMLSIRSAVRQTEEQPAACGTGG